MVVPSSFIWIFLQRLVRYLIKQAHYTKETMKKIILVMFCMVLLNHMNGLLAQLNGKSAARVWMDAAVEVIKRDGFGPTVHARNMYHMSAAMYDAWTVYEEKPQPLFLGNTIDGFEIPFDFSKFPIPESIDSARTIAVNYAAYRVLRGRFQLYPSKDRTIDTLQFLFEALGYKESMRSTDYTTGSPEALGNYIGKMILDFGFQEPAGDLENYVGENYNPINFALLPNYPGNPRIQHPNRWQPLSIKDYINKKGWDSTLVDWNFLLIGPEDEFLTPHWGQIVPFAMGEKQRKVLHRDGVDYIVYNDPGPPPYISSESDPENSDAYKWNFSLVSIWGGHCDPDDTTMIDISPRSIGSTKGMLPLKYAEYEDFYNLEKGGTKTTTTLMNPKTGEEYAPNWVKRGDYARVIAEYWVDGVNTASPPGHWVTTLNSVSDHPSCEKKWKGKGERLDDLTWDIFTYLALTGAMHDAGISAWSVKAYYDYVRPISAIRWLAGNGQCSDEALPNYNPQGIPLIEGRIELIEEGDPLAGDNNANVGKIKLYSWRGPDNVDNPKTDYAGVGWILAENWWPYQRYSFATPPFAGYISGHSTFSTAAADVLTYITGDPYFPGGIRELTMKKHDFLQFEDGPSEDITLQWSTYREAADETCLSRIWGGIHPPVDDIKGRIVGEQVAKDAFTFVSRLLSNR